MNCRMGQDMSDSFGRVADSLEGSLVDGYGNMSAHDITKTQILVDKFQRSPFRNVRQSIVLTSSRKFLTTPYVDHSFI